MSAILKVRDNNGQIIEIPALRGPKGPEGVGIESIEKTSTEGLVDTYTITLSDGSTSTFTVTNGENGEATTNDNLSALLNFVTPEMFGAVGDGETDDTDAIQQAMNTGCPVEFDKNKQYKVSGFAIESNIDLRGNGATLLCAGKTFETGAHCFYISESDDETKLYDVKISNLNIIVTRHLVSVFKGNQGKSLVIDNCTVEGNASLALDIEDSDSPGASQGFSFYNFSKFAITNNIINNIRSYAISAEEYNSNGVISGNKINGTGRGGIYARAFNKNVEVTKNELRNTMRCFTVCDGAIDLYGAGNENIYINKNFITGWGSSQRSGIGIRIKGSKNVVCAENTVITDETTNSFALILTQDRYKINCENIIIEKNYLSALAGTSSYVIRDDYEPEEPCAITKDLTIQNNCIIFEIGMGISIRRKIENLFITKNVITNNSNGNYAINFSDLEKNERNNVICDHNNITGCAVYITYANKLKFTNNVITYNRAEISTFILKGCPNAFVSANTITNAVHPRVVSYSDCPSLNITETNLFETSTGISKLASDIFVSTATGDDEISFSSLADSVASIQVFGHSQQPVDSDEDITPEHLVEYTSANTLGDLTLTVNDTSCADSVIKRGLPADYDLANYIDSNGQGWIADYRDWVNGIDWHYVEEYIFTGTETVTNYSEDSVIVTWSALKKEKRSLSSSLRYYYDMYSNAFNSYRSGKEKRFNVASDLGNTFVIKNYNKDFFVDAEGFKTMCKNLFDNGTPIKILYALKVPYSTPIPENELAAYQRISMPLGTNTVSNNQGLFIKILHLLNDDYITGVKNIINKDLSKLTYSREQIDQALASYITDVAAIVGGDA